MYGRFFVSDIAVSLVVTSDETGVVGVSERSMAMQRREFLAAFGAFMASATAGCVLGPVTITGPIQFQAPLTGERRDVLWAHISAEYGAGPADNPLAFAVRRDGQWMFPGDEQELAADWAFLVQKDESVLVWPAEDDPPQELND